MSDAPAELVKAARQGRLNNLEVSVLNQDPLLLQKICNTPNPGGVGTVRELNKLSQPSTEAILDWEKGMGTVAALTAGLDPVERKQVWNIGEEDTPEDTVEYTGILEEFWDVFAWNMAEMTTIKDEQFRIPVQILHPSCDNSTDCRMLKRKSLQSKWKNAKLDSLDL
jgi:hypothetical protein